MMKLILVLTACICSTVALAGVGLVEFSCDGPMVFEGERSVKTAGMPGITNSLVLEAGRWQVGAKAFEVVIGEVLRLGELTSKDGQPIHETKPSGKSGKLRVTAAEKVEWRLWGEDVWRKGPAEITVPSGVYRLELREKETVQGRLLAVDEDQQVPLAISHPPQVLVESKTEGEMLVGPNREGPPQLGDVAVLRNARSEVVAWQRLRKPVERLSQFTESSIPLVVFYSPARKIAIESIMKRLGIGTPVDSDSSQSLALLAADKDDALGLYSLAVNYMDGVGTTKDTSRAEALFQKAVIKLLSDTEKADAWSQTALGQCYRGGFGVLKSDKKAAELFNESVIANLAWTQSSLGDCYLNGQGVTKNAAIAADLYRKASDQGDVGALFSLARCSASGEGVVKDTGQAILLTRKAAESGLLVAQTSLGACLLAGHGIKKDLVEGVKWTRMAAEKGEATAQHNLGMCYIDGNGVASDAVQANHWFKNAAEQGDALAQGALGVSYATGNGIEKDHAKAFFWLSKSAAKGIALSQVALGIAYANGEGVKQDVPTAISWLRKAAKQGAKQAEKLLQNLDADTKPEISEPTRAASSDVIPVAAPISGKRGYVKSPFVPNNQPIDVREFQPGQRARCPYSGNLFIVP